MLCASSFRVFIKGGFHRGQQNSAAAAQKSSDGASSSPVQKSAGFANMHSSLQQNCNHRRARALRRRTWRSAWEAPSAAWRWVAGLGGGARWGGGVARGRGALAWLDGEDRGHGFCTFPAGSLHSCPTVLSVQCSAVQCADGLPGRAACAVLCSHAKPRVAPRRLCWQAVGRRASWSSLCQAFVGLSFGAVKPFFARTHGAR